MGEFNLTDEHLPSSVFFAVILGLDSLCVLFGVLGNVGVIIYNIFMNNSRTPTTYFTVNLAIADLLVCTTFFPTWMVEFTDIVLGKEGTEKASICKIIITSSTASVGLSILNLTAITLDKYIFISRPLKYPIIMTWRRTYFMLLMIWILTIVNGNIVGFHTTETARRLYCKTEPFSLEFGLGAFNFYIPATIMIYLNYKIFQVAKDQRRKIRTENTVSHSAYTTGNEVEICPDHNSTSDVSQRSVRLKQQFKIVKTFAIVIGVFLFCLTPFVIVAGIDRNVDCNDLCVPTSVYISTGFLVGANSVLNPFIYGIRHKAYRIAYRKLFSKLSTCGNI